MSLEEALNLLVVGVTTGAIYGLIALSFNVVYATSGVLNIAQGEFFMAGGMLGVFLYVDQRWPLFAALLATVALVALLGALEEVIAVRPATAKGEGAFGWLLSTLGFAIALRAVFALRMGADNRAFPEIVSAVPTDIGGVLFIPQQLLVVGVLVVTVVATGWLYRHTLLGLALGAIAQDSDAAALRQVPVRRLTTLAFALGAAIAALAGFVTAPLTTASASIGFGFALKGFVAAALGGIGDTRGALAGGLALGVLEVYGVRWMGPAYRDALVFLVLLVVLAARPNGILGRTVARAV